MDHLVHPLVVIIMLLKLSATVAADLFVVVLESAYGEMILFFWRDRIFFLFLTFIEVMNNIS